MANMNTWLFCIVDVPNPSAKFMDTIRIWNTELIFFAGYEMEDGTVVGDKSSVRLTKVQGVS